jgi:hemolysin III
MKRLDHSMIFLFIAGTYTPFALLTVDQPFGAWLLAGVWAGALAGVALKLAWPTAPRWLGVPIYIGLGWVAVFILGDILRFGGVTVLVLLAVGGLLYTVGAIAYATKWPNPVPGVFGYHEVFHAMTIVAALCHQIAVYFAMYGSPFLP